MQRYNRFGKLLAGVLMLGIVSAACSQTESRSDGQSPTAIESPMTEGVGLDEGAIALQQTLTDLLDSHVYLASITVSTGLSTGLDSPEFTAAAETLDQNSIDLSEAIGSVYGDEGAGQFLKLWREHIGFFVDYTAGKATKDRQMADQALEALSNYREDFAAFLDSATGGELPADAAADSLQMHVDSLIAAIDAAVAGDPAVFGAIYTAASDHMPHTASALAGAISAQMPEEFGTA